MLSEIRLLEKMPLFEGLSPQELEKIAEKLHLVNLKKGTTLTKEGEVAKKFYIVLSGEYEIKSSSGFKLRLDKRGDFIGWATIIAAPKYIGTGTTVKDGEALLLSGLDFIDLLRSDADLGNKIMENGSKLALEGKPFG